MAKDSEADLLAKARQYSFRARMDSKSQRGEVAGPVFVSGQGSEVEDITGRRWLDFNSGQMCAALGHNHVEKGRCQRPDRFRFEVEGGERALADFDDIRRYDADALKGLSLVDQ